MELTLSAYLDDARTRLCVVDVEPSVPGREVVAALATHLGVAAQGLDAWNVRTKGRIAPDEPVSAAMLLSGDQLLLTPAAAPPQWGARQPTLMPPPYVLSVIAARRAGSGSTSPTA